MNAAHSAEAVHQDQRKLAEIQLVDEADGRRAADHPADDRDEHDEDDEQERDEDARVERRPGDRPRQQHLQGPARPLAGDRRRRGADREDPEHRDRQRMLEAEGDAARQREERAGAEVHHLLREGAGVREVPDDVAELVVDDRDDGAPRDARHDDDEQADALPAQRLSEEPPVHCAAASGSSAVTSPSPSA